MEEILKIVSKLNTSGHTLSNSTIECNDISLTNLLSNSKNWLEHLKYLGNAYCVLTNRIGNQDMQANHKTTN